MVAIGVRADEVVMKMEVEGSCGDDNDSFFERVRLLCDEMETSVSPLPRGSLYHHRHKPSCHRHRTERHRHKTECHRPACRELCSAPAPRGQGLPTPQQNGVCECAETAWLVSVNLL